MEQRPLGNTGLEIPAIGFGCWAIGGHGYGFVDDKESVRAVHRALDLGITFFDTADVYGFGHSEKVLGRALGRQKNQVIIATKFGVNWDANGRTYKDCSSRRIREALEGSLRRLGIDCIPLYQIHWYDGITPVHDMIETLRKFKQEGKIQHIGCTNFSIGFIKQLLAMDYRLETLQVEYNLLQREHEKTIRHCKEELGMGIIVYSVLARGLFSGKYGPRSKFGKDDTRSRDKVFSESSLESDLVLVQALQELAIKYGKTPSQVAIQWTIQKGNISSAIVGVKNVAQIEENAGSVGWTLDQADNDYLERIADKVSADNSLINQK